MVGNLVVALFACILLGMCCAPANGDAAAGTIRGGGKCSIGRQCFSGFCSNSVCAADSPIRGMVGENGACRENRHCHSNRCSASNRICKKEKDASTALGPNQQASKGVWYGSIRQGGACTIGRECFSSICFNRKCQNDSPQPGKVGQGGQCREDHHCFSDNCNGRVCIAGKTTSPSPAFNSGDDFNSGDSGNGDWDDGGTIGGASTIRATIRMVQTTTKPTAPAKLRQAANCSKDEQCFCGYCDYGKCSKDSAVMGKVANGGRCRRDHQCLSNLCGVSVCS